MRIIRLLVLKVHLADDSRQNHANEGSLLDRQHENIASARDRPQIEMSETQGQLMITDEHAHLLRDTQGKITTLRKRMAELIR